MRLGRVCLRKRAVGGSGIRFSPGSRQSVRRLRPLPSLERKRAPWRVGWRAERGRQRIGILCPHPFRGRRRIQRCHALRQWGESQAERCRLVALPHRFRFSWEVFKGASAPRNLCRVCRSARMDCARKSGSQEATDGGNVHQEEQATGVAANGKREITAKRVVRLLI